jgi:hypothetical protein
MATSKVAREIRVAVRGGEVYRCRPDWDVNEARSKIREGSRLDGGWIEDENGMMRGTDLIGNAVGDLTFMGGRDPPPPQPAPATASASAGMTL